MVDIPSLDVAATGAFSRFHNYAKNVETAHLGNLYSSTLDNLHYYAIESVAKPALSKAPEWVSDNRVVSIIRSHQGISMAVGAALTLISIVSFWIWLHPAGKTTTPPNNTLPPSGDDDDTDSVGDLDVRGSGTVNGTRSEGDGTGTRVAGEKRSEGDKDPFAEKPVDPRDAKRTSQESTASASVSEEEDERDRPTQNGVKINLYSSFTNSVADGVVDTFDYEELGAGGASPPPKEEKRRGGDSSKSKAVPPPAHNAGTSSYAPVVAPSGDKPAQRADEKTRSAPATPTQFKPPVEQSDAEIAPPIWISSASGYGTVSLSQTNEESVRTENVVQTSRSGGKKKKKGKKGNK